MNQLAFIVFQRGRLDDAEEIQRRSAPILEANPEPQAEVYVFATEGQIALARGRVAEALERFRRGVELSRGFTLEQGPALFYELVRLLVRTGDRASADTYRDLSARGQAPATKAYASAVEGLLEADRERAVRRFDDAATAFERLGMRIMQARVLIDLGEAQARSGEDPAPVLERARGLLTACDARVYLPEVEALLADTRR